MRFLLKCAAVSCAVCLVSVSQPANADAVHKPDPGVITVDYRCGDDMMWAFDWDTGTLTFSGSGEMWDFTEKNVPWKNMTYSVHQIAFDGAIESIGDYAFQDCIMLKSVAIPTQITRIGDRAFRRCAQLEEISLPDGLTEIGDAAFLDDRLETVSLPETVRSIGASAFEDNKYLTAVC